MHRRRSPYVAFTTFLIDEMACGSDVRLKSDPQDNQRHYLLLRAAMLMSAARTDPAKLPTEEPL